MLPLETVFSDLPTSLGTIMADLRSGSKRMSIVGFISATAAVSAAALNAGAEAALTVCTA
jgi:hypothetical protein